MSVIEFYPIAKKIEDLKNKIFSVIRTRPGGDLAEGFLLLKLHALKTDKEKVEYLEHTLNNYGADLREMVERTQNELDSTLRKTDK